MCLLADVSSVFGLGLQRGAEKICLERGFLRPAFEHPVHVCVELTLG